MSKNTDNPAIGSNWEDVRKQLYAPDEIAASDARVALIGELIKARQEKGLTQKQLEEISGVRQPVIARLERGHTNAQIDTIIKLLVSLGKTLTVVPLQQKEN